jgi:hypothetical protein
VLGIADAAEISYQGVTICWYTCTAMGTSAPQWSPLARRCSRRWQRILFAELVPFHGNRECAPDPVIIRVKARDF